MDHLVGKKLGKLVIIEIANWPDNEKGKRFKYGPRCLRVLCECGNERLIPARGYAGLKSCGCAQYDHLKVGAHETIQYFPDRPRVARLREKPYADL